MNAGTSSQAPTPLDGHSSPASEVMSFLTLQDAILELMASNAPLTDIMYALCSEVERLAPQIIASTLRLDEHQRMRPLASPSLPSSYNEGVDGEQIGPTVGTCGVAMTYGRPHLTRDIETDPNWRDFRTLVAPLGLRTCWSQPIKRRDGRVLGSLAFYYRRPHEPTPFDHQIAEICLRLCTLAFEHEDMQRSIQKLAYHDALTGLPNRARFELEFGRVMDEVRRNDSHFSLLFIDLNRFKQINDTQGHLIGDAMLRQVASRLQRAVRGLDFVGRLGGDEFVVVVRHGNTREVTAAAERILHVLCAPFYLQGDPTTRIDLGASIGVAIYPEDGTDLETLLHHADIAMYRAKDAGESQIRFYAPPSGPPEQAVPGSAAARHAKPALAEDRSSPLYGAPAEPALARLSEAVGPHLSAIVEQFYENLSRMPGAEHLINSLSPAELAHLKKKQAENLAQLCSPHLTADQHHGIAMHVGRIHAICGLSRENLVHSLDSLYAILREHIDTTQHGQALSVLNRRLLKDLGWQMQAAQQIQAGRQETLSRISELSWNARNYTDLITQTAEILSNHDGITGAIFLRPDERNLLKVEAQAGAGMTEFLDAIERQQLDWLAAGENPLKPGPTEQAWNAGVIHRSLNYFTDEKVRAWRTVVGPKGIRSSISIPLVSPNSQTVISVLALYCRLPGGLSSQEQDFFLTQVQSLLAFGISRLETWSGPAIAIPYTTRRRWLELLQKDGLEMYYQPVVDLRTGQVIKVEALARLRDTGMVLTPAEFFPALSSEDFLKLYVKGLDQALKQRAEWLRKGIALDIAVNLPTAALEDERYVKATGRALREYACPPGALTLELLEGEEISSSVNVVEALLRYKALGVKLAEDDLGSGYSSLARLREMPFDIIKIDRSIVSHTEREPFNTLRFVYQLTRLGHGLGKKVIVEGVEDSDLLEAITILGADCVQGFVIARPMPAPALEDWFLRQAPRVIEPFQSSSTQSRLAELLIWEEAMHVLLDRTPDLPSKHGLVEDMCRFLTTLPLAAPAVAAAVSDLIASAMAFGLRSPAYTLARKRMIAAMLQGQKADGAGR
ncbi:hypothetical protein CAL29_22740 [Bordetella genomosp. 10]|uniref:Diguanylate cyclase DosC n=1 Tax=Bordetella genomosp. 10 TaxID=1416804 RepID=A0A261S0Y3_9BORD|nr:EAL domain-containing protein [Bordetella genomosp. 10]OZI30801.1 hypothetical protein CAL29_22740 [Bordetella genomosp. 10]